MAKNKKSRGDRNNNPGNIRLSSDQWKGLSDKQTDKEFFQFTKPEYGIRAINKILNTYNRKYGLNSIHDILYRWAPPNENNTDAYIKSVATQTGLSVMQPIRTSEERFAVVKAIIRHENGYRPYHDETINIGVSLP